MENEIVLSYKQAHEQIEDLQKVYSDLMVSNDMESIITLKGSITVNQRVEGFVLCKTYEIRVEIPTGTHLLPQIYEEGGAIDKKYQHKYKGGQLCLETDTSIRLYFIDGFNLCEWMDRFVISYFMSYEFYKKYGIFPFGDRKHGCSGILQTYQDLWNVKDEDAALEIMLHICCNTYRGHLQCPCGSGKRIRNCHGKAIMDVYNNPRVYELLCKDTISVVREKRISENNSNKNTNFQNLGGRIWKTW